MYTLRVESFNGAPTQALSATFDERGGTIGRHEKNVLVLPDPEQLVSRVHARVECRNGVFMFVDQGVNPAVLNGRTLGAGREAPLADGDRLQIGGFVIAVSRAQPAERQAVEPFSDFSDLWDELPAATPRRASAASAAANGRLQEDWVPFDDTRVPELPDETVRPLRPQRPGASAQPAQVRQAPLPADTAVLLAALLEGLDTPGLDTACLDAERMRAIGALLRETIEGTVQLLQGRAAFKRELRAQVTTIRQRENNPLKFSPDAATALRHLMAPQGPGFMAPQDALRDAYDDLRAHEIAVMAGLRAALDGLLERFSPPALERRIAPRGVASLLPAARKAELWEQFGVLYGKISQEAAEGFYDLLGSSFLKAYEAETRRLRKEAESHV